MRPDRLGPYKVLEEIGGGGMGVVYLVATLEGHAALKVLAPGWDLPGTLRRFRKEAEALRELDHPGFVRYLDHGDALDTPDGPRPFLLMEYIEGESLRERIRPGGLPPDEVLAIVQELSAALEYAHERGIVHRDLKPENIIIEAGTGRPRILDLGIARLPENWQTTANASTRAGELLGTVRYMSPEQARGRADETGPASDIYSLAVVAYELLTGALPYEAGNETLHELLAAILTEQPVPLRKRNPDLSATLNSVLVSALAKDPTARPRSVSAFARDAVAAQRGDPRQQVRTVWRGLRQRRNLLARLLTVLLVAGAVGWTLNTRRETPPKDLPGVYRKLGTAAELVHFWDRTPERLRAAIDTLSTARQDLWTGHLSWRGPLERYIAIRLGEAGYLLGMAEEDPDRLRWATARYVEAASFSCTLAERAQIPADCPIRSEILLMAGHMPYAGLAMTHQALALLDLPMRHLDFAQQAGMQGTMVVSGTWTPPSWDGPPFDASVSLRRTQISRATMWNDYGGILSEFAALSDSLAYLEAAIHAFSVADTLPVLEADRPAYASFQNQYGVALRRRGEWTSSPGDLDEGERRLRVALEIRRPDTVLGALTRAELARLEAARAELTGAGIPALEAATREVETIWDEIVSEAGNILVRARVAVTRSWVAAALADAGGSPAPAERADSLLASILSGQRMETFPRVRAELYLERARLAAVLDGSVGAGRPSAGAYVDSALAVLPADQYPALVREAARLRSL